MTLDEALRKRSVWMVECEDLIDLADTVDSIRKDIRGGAERAVRATELPALDCELRNIVDGIESRLAQVKELDESIDAFYTWMDAPERRTPAQKAQDEARKHREWRQRNYPHMYRITH
jgi:hypothetical protein